MPIQTSELRFYKSTTVSDTTSNGGRISASEIADGVKNNVWPDVPQGERLAGSTKYRKVFFKVANDADIKLIDPRIYVETATPGDDRILIFPGTQTDTQGALTGSERLYGSGRLDASTSIGVTSIDVNTESATDAIFQNGDLIRISDQDHVDDVSGNVEFIRLASSGGVTWNGDKATLTFEAGQSLQSAYASSNTRVASVIEPEDIEATWGSWTGSTVAGTYDGSGPTIAPTNIIPILDSIGSIEQTWTLTFSDANSFSCVGDMLGSVGSGSLSGGDFAPNNPDFSRPYFTLPVAGWGGAWSSGETITFKTHPAAVPIWWKRIVPAGANSLSADKVVVAITGESA
ncbi:hypothetical protein Mmc1_1340 [Magnetococcus marinus MC-1]|uniref:Uncharacterized protein n=1 Tax=Magnetococcus marinus (strain ATCC BAA-1437 / JCM 17883 / MC-1) TaxID=156889 RepID=A0L7A8_MAGMM|nr:hypothetical protein [Magnetococcus marinus]ABK43851.1 hypothetical protein Mmc1_1340 [Magnetococcus marinus MC-1]